MRFSRLIAHTATCARLLYSLVAAVIAMSLPASALSLISQQPLAELPIELIDNRVQLDLSVQGYELKFALDTGASRTVIFQSDKYDFEDLPSVADTRVLFPALDEFVQGRKLVPLPIMLGEHVFTPSRPILIRQRPPIGDRLSFKFDGILGRDFFEQFVVEIAPNSRTMRLYEKGTDLRDYFQTYIPLYMKGSAAHVRFRSKLPWEKNPSMKELLLDTGYPGAMVIWDTGHFRKAAGTSKVEPFQEQNKGIVTLAGFRVGTLRFDRVPLFVAPSEPKQAQERDGLIGNNVLAQFHHVIDFGRQQLLLSSKRRYRHPVDGTFYPPNNEDFIVKDYRPKSITMKQTVG